MLTALLTLSLAGFGPSIEVDAPVYGPNPRSTYAPQLVAGSNQFLAAFSDDRGDDSGWAAYSNLILTRLDANGAVLDPGGIEPYPAGATRNQFGGAFDGTNYLVAWVEGETQTASGIHALRLSPAGQVLDSPSLTLATGNVNRYRASVAYDGTQFVVAWSENDSTTDASSIQVATVSSAGVVSAPIQVAASATAFYQLAGVASAGAGQSLIVWVDGTASAAAVSGATYSAGQAGAPAAVSLPGMQARWAGLSVAGSGYFAAWEEEASATAGYSLVGLPLDSNGSRGTTSEITYAPPTTSVYARGPSLASTGAGLVLSWTEQPALTAETVVALAMPYSGTPAGPEQTLNASGEEAGGPMLACAGSTCLGAWTTQESGLSYSEAFFSPLGATAAPLDTTRQLLSTPANAQSEVALANDGRQILVAWNSTTGLNPPELRVRRMGLGGSWIDATGTVLPAQASSTPEAVAPLVDGGFLLVWDTPIVGSSPLVDEVRASVIGSDGVVATQQGQIVDSSTYYGFRSPQAVCGSAGCLVLYFDQSYDSFCRVVDGTGAGAGDAGTYLDAWSDSVAIGSMAFVGGDYWLPYAQGSTIGVKRVTPQGALVTPDLVVSTAETSAGAPQVAVGTAAVSFFWKRTLTNPSTQVLDDELRTGQIDLSGNVTLAPQTILTPANFGFLFPVQLIDDGANLWALYSANDGTDSWAARLQQLTSGLAPSGAPLDVFTNLYTVFSPVASAVGPDDILFGDEVRDTSPQRGSHRIRLTWLGGTTLGNGSACLNPSDCTTGFCEDGVCCDNACGGGVTSDCQACAVAAGAAVDGTCGPAGATTVCQPAGPCSAASSCDGSALTCPGAGSSGCADGGVDAGKPTVDAGSADAGKPEVDAGPTDAGAPPEDGGNVIRPHGSDGGTVAAPSGCGCQQLPGSSGFAFAAGLWLLHRRRQRA